MAEDATNHLNYYLELSVKHKDFLGQIRHWENLKYGIETESIWVKNFTESQLDSIELKSIPFANLYSGKENLLFPKGSLLPSRKIPNLLWTPLVRALKIEIGDFNHNYFGLNQSLDIKLISSENEQPAFALLVDFDSANSYISSASSARMKPLSWLSVDSNKALILGNPILPISGKVYWRLANFLLPNGFEFEFAIIEQILETKLQLTQNQIIWWSSENEYLIIEKDNFRPLTIASWKLTHNLV